MRKEFILGMLAFSIVLTVRQFFALPEFLMGTVLTMAIALELVGALPEKQYQSIKQLKKKLWKKA